ncbi:MAG: hypothetical protein R3304_05125 [Longimicrobiales bacterium]|nr:hypothetical protein [Longimicrobiales bacterium]
MIRDTLPVALALGLVLAVSAACGDPVRPYDPVAEPGDPPPGGAVGDSFPPVPESSTAYDRVSPYSSGTISRYVLDTTGGFELQYLSSSLAYHALPGTYAREGSELRFDFEAWSLAGPWKATGILEKDTLRVSYNVVMLLSDFQDGVFIRR